MANSAIGFDAMTASALAILTDASLDGAPLIGYAFDSIGRYAKDGLLVERFIPRLLAAPAQALLDRDGVIDPMRCRAVLMANEKDGGHGERPGAVGLLDAALWDLRAKARRQPLYRCLATRLGTTAQPEIDVYASCGHFRAQDDGRGLRAEIDACRAAGHTCVKIKVGIDGVAASERLRIAADAMGHARAVAIDVNGALEPVATGDWLARVGALGPAWIEEPVTPLDYEALAQCGRQTHAALGTGENLFSFDDARNLLRYGGLHADRDRLQFDVSLSYGVGEFIRIVEHYERAGWSRRQFWPHAGHLFAAQVVAGLALGGHEMAADAAAIYGGAWDGSRVEQGRLRIPDVPGVGFEAKSSLHAVLAPLARL